jgi:hypothetical protein
MNELRFAVRQLLKSPAFTAVAAGAIAFACALIALAAAAQEPLVTPACEGFVRHLAGRGDDWPSGWLERASKDLGPCRASASAGREAALADDLVARAVGASRGQTANRWLVETSQAALCLLRIPGVAAAMTSVARDIFVPHEIRAQCLLALSEGDIARDGHAFEDLLASVALRETVVDQAVLLAAQSAGPQRDRFVAALLLARDARASRYDLLRAAICDARAARPAEACAVSPPGLEAVWVKEREVRQQRREIVWKGLWVTGGLVCFALSVFFFLGARANNELSRQLTPLVSLLAGAGLGSALGVRAYETGGSGGLEGIGLVLSGAAGLVAGIVAGGAAAFAARRSGAGARAYITAAIAVALSAAAISWFELFW